MLILTHLQRLPNTMAVRGGAANDDKMLIEVKGASAGASSVQLSAPQVALAREFRHAFILAVVHTENG